MSLKDTRNAFVSKIITATALPVAYENAGFDPSNLDSWLAVYLIPATTGSLGKTIGSGDDHYGIFQISVYVKADNKTAYDSVQLDIIDDLTTAFYYGSVLISNTQEVHILESTVNEGSRNGAWFKRDISVNYFTITQRQ